MRLVVEDGVSVHGAGCRTGLWCECWSVALVALVVVVVVAGRLVVVVWCVRVVRGLRYEGRRGLGDDGCLS